MSNRLKAIICVSALIAVLVVAVVLLRGALLAQQDEIKRLQSNIDALTTKIDHRISSDGKEIAEVKIETLTKAEIKEILKEELATINVKSKDVHSITTVVEESQTKVKLDTVIVHDTIIAMQYHDKWIDLSIIGDSAQIATYDSILIVNHAKTRRFLFWTWKKYSGKTSIKTYSPYAHTTSIQAIEIKE